MTMLEDLTGALGASGALGRLSAAIGTNDDTTRSMLGAGLPAVLGALGRHVGDDAAGPPLAQALSADGGSLFDSAGSFFEAGDRSGLASNLVGTLFGGGRGAVESAIASAGSGFDLSAVTRLLPMIAPVAMSWLGRRQADEGLDAEGFAAALGAELDGAREAGAGTVLDALGDGEEDRQGFIDGLAHLDEAGGLQALIPQVTSSATGAASGGVSSTAVAAGAGGAAMAGSAWATRDRSGLGWLLPILLLAGGLVLGLILWQCLGDDERIVTAAAPEPTAVPAPTATPEPEPTATPEPEPTATPVPEPTPTPEPPPAPPTIAELAADTGDLSTLGRQLAARNLNGALGDPDAGPFTVFAPTNAAFGDAGELIGRLDDGQITTTLTYHVVDGLVPSSEVVPGATFTTLAGETIVIGGDGSLPGGRSVLTADLEASNGIVHIIDGVLVPGSVTRGLASADLNALFVLEPIQFAVNSAEILPESVPTLDQAIVTLTSLPAGSKFEVAGHTDSDGDEAFNQTLSEARAQSVVDYLVGGGVDPDMLTAVGYGETQLKVDPELTPEDKFMNRRIEFVDRSS